MTPAMGDSALRAAIEPLPDDAQVPVRWVREKLGEEAEPAGVEIDLTVDEAGELLGRSGSTVARWCREGAINGYRMGREWRIPRAALEDFQRDLAEPDGRRLDSKPYELEKWRRQA